MSAVPLMSLHTQVTDDTQDSDQITDEDEDPLESVLKSMKYRTQINRARDFWTAIIFAGVLFFVAGFSSGYITFLGLDNSKPIPPIFIAEDPMIALAILKEINGTKIAEFMRSFNIPSSGNISDSLKQAQQVQQHFKDQEMDSVSDTWPSHILLSYFKDDLNIISVLDSDGDVVYRSTPLYFNVPPEINTFEVTNITVGNVVYLDFGRESDFHYLETRHISVKNLIILARVGNVSPIDLVDTALKHGAKGVILVTDEDQNINGKSEDEGYKSLLLPSQLGMLQFMHGNPSLHTNDGVDNRLRCVPVQIITATVADQVIKHIFPDDMAMNWKTNLSTFYSSDFNYITRQLKMKVHIVNTQKTFYNVIATMSGSREPDRYILLVNNREAVLPNEVDPMGGTAVMMELVRVLAEITKNTGWRPRRTLVFCSWGVSRGDQHISSAPLPEQWGHLLESHALGYIKVDAAVSSTSFSAQATPLLVKVLFESAALVPNPHHEEIVKGRKTLYDAWLHTTPENISKPFVNIIQDYGDMHTIIHNYGIPSLEFQFANLEKT